MRLAELCGYGPWVISLLDFNYSIPAASDINSSDENRGCIDCKGKQISVKHNSKDIDSAYITCLELRNDGQMRG
jgi:hypothetical protein